MVRRPKTVSVSRAEAGLYLAKAEQFSAEAVEALGSSRNDAAMLNAIHAAISAVDATLHVPGEWWGGLDGGVIGLGPFDRINSPCRPEESAR